MVVTAEEEASRVGVEILKRGGNAADAAIAVHFALAVTLPSAGNIGGGGFMVLRDASGEVTTYDYRERAPLTATEDMYLDDRGRVIDDLSWFGWKAVATPGSVAGMALVHERHGSVPWGDLIAPAIRLAEDGFTVDAYTRRMIEGKAEAIRRYPGAAAILMPDGRIPEVGDTLRQPTLARTLRLIAMNGPDVFYHGEIADSIVASMRENGGSITRQDLDQYEVRERLPVTFDYRGHTIHSMGPPSSGGIALKLILDQLEGYDLGRYEWHGAASVHRVAEAMRRAFAERNALLGDPDFVDIPGALLTEEYARQLAATIDTLEATSSGSIRPELSALVAESTETTHFSIVDGDGNAVASTTTLNGSFGSLATAAGFFFNNEMDDLTVKPGIANAYGLVQGRNNAVQPGKRPLSAMTPTIVERNGRVRFVIGSPGGSTIITTVAQILINTIDYGMTLAEAVDARRFHHQHLPDWIRTEMFGLSPETIGRLRAMGHEIRIRKGYWGRAQGIEVGLEDGLLYARSDLRGGGMAAGF